MAQVICCENKYSLLIFSASDSSTFACQKRRIDCALTGLQIRSKSTTFTLYFYFQTLGSSISAVSTPQIARVESFGSDFLTSLASKPASKPYRTDQTKQSKEKITHFQRGNAHFCLSCDAFASSSENSQRHPKTHSARKNRFVRVWVCRRYAIDRGGPKFPLLPPPLPPHIYRFKMVTDRF